MKDFKGEDAPPILPFLEFRKILAGQQNLGDLYQGCRKFIETQFGFKDIALILYDPSMNSQTKEALDSVLSIPQDELKELTDASLSLWVWKHQETVRIQDTEKETLFSEYAQLLLRHGFRSCECVPLTTARRRLGSLIIWSKKPHAFENFDLNLCSLITSEISSAVDNVIYIAELASANELLRNEITQRNRVEKALHESENRYRTIVEMQPELICRYLPDTTLTFVNDAYCKWFRKENSELIGTSFLLLLPEESRSAAQDHVRSLCENPRIVPNEHQVLTSDGEMRWQQWVDCLILDDQGSVKELQGVGRDITDRKRAEEALVRMSEQLAHVTRTTTIGELTASIAHEVNQPLTAIIHNGNACLHWLADDTFDIGNLREAVSDMIKDGKRASDIIQRIRMLIKKKPLQRVPLNLNEVILEVISLMRDELERNQIVLRTQLTTNLPEVTGDRIELQQVIQNLIMNGMDAMNAVPATERELLIRSQYQESSDILISVCDSGEGFNPEIASSLFEPFFTTKPQGLGIGLSISRSIMEAHGGRLWAVPNTDHGATFSFMLPSAGSKPPDR